MADWKVEEMVERKVEKLELKTVEQMVFLMAPWME